MPAEVFENDYCEANFYMYGLPCWDMSWMFDWYWSLFNKFFWPCLEKFMFYISITPQDYYDMVVEFNFLEAFTGMEWNPLRWYVEFWINLGPPFFNSGYTLESIPASPDDTGFAEIFGEELYTIYYNHVVVPPKAIIAEMLWRYENGVKGFIPDWILDHCVWDWVYEYFGFNLRMLIDLFTDPRAVFYLIYGVEAECFDVYLNLHMKFMMFFLILGSWIGYLFALLIRFFTLIIWWLIYFFIEIINWIILNIFIPIFQLLWPIIEFFFTIYYWIMYIFWMIVWWIIAVWWLIYDFFYSIFWMIFCFFLFLHDFLWSIWWMIFDILWPIFYWILQVLWFIPYWIMYIWYYVWNIIIPPLDEFCVNFLELLEENLLDPIIENLKAPEW